MTPAAPQYWHCMHWPKQCDRPPHLTVCHTLRPAWHSTIKHAELGPLKQLHQQQAMLPPSADRDVVTSVSGEAEKLEEQLALSQHSQASAL